MVKKVNLTGIFSLIILIATAQVSVTSSGFIYQQDFNSLAASGTNNNWTNNSTLPGWYATAEITGDYTTYRAGTGSSSTTGLYSFGDAPSDRALGSLNQNASGTIAFGILLENNSGVTLRTLSITYHAEQWRRAQTNTKGYQWSKLSLKTGDPVDVSSSGLLADDFVDFPEGHLVCLDTTTLDPSSALNGNDGLFSASISLEIPIHLPAGHQVFIRFLDLNVSDLDHALAIDDLEIELTDDISDRVTAVSDYSFTAYTVPGIVSEIPSEDDGIAYLNMADTSIADWHQILDDFYNDQYLNVVANASEYGYILVEYTANGSGYYVLRKNTTSEFYWGSFIRRINPSNECIVIQAPHPVKDSFTGIQAASVFESMGAAELMISGISRCTSPDYVACAGTTSICGSDENFRHSDPSHNDSSVFHLATATVNDNFPERIFVQLHGFAKEPTDPHFIFSNGTEFSPTTDYLITLKNELLNSNPSFDTDLVHIDGATKLKAETNVQGRLINNYAQNICTSSTDPDAPSGRFLHLEQFYEFREWVEYYEDLANALSNSIDCGVILPVKWLNFHIDHPDDFRVRLNWSVASESSEGHFEVERSTDGAHFKKVSNILIKNNEKESYSFVDQPGLSVLLFYRIKWVSVHGETEYSPVLKTRLRNQLRVYPNPAEDLVIISGIKNKTKGKIIDLSGKTVMNFGLETGHNELSIAHLTEGLYYLYVEGIVTKLLKSH